MPSKPVPRPVIPITFNASVVGQLLGAFACFLAAFVLPANYPELRGRTASILVIVGCVLLTLGLLNLLLGSWLSQWTRRFGMRSRVVLPREGMVYLGIMLVIAVGALLGHSNMLLLVFGMMAGPFVLNGWVVISMLHRIDVSRHLPANATAGEYFSVEIRLTNRKKWLASRLVEVRDVIQGLGIRSEPSVTFVCVRPGESRSCSYQVNVIRRGRYRLGPLRVSSRFPLGIGERGRAISEPAELLIHPQIGRLQPSWHRNTMEHSNAPSRAVLRRGLHDDELHNIREYREGDNSRAIHWRTTARKGEVMVREYEQDREAELTILFDLQKGPEHTTDLEELAVSLVATLCHEQVSRSQSGAFALMIAGKKLADIRSSGGASFRKAAFDALATCAAAAQVDLTPLAAAACESISTATGRCVVVTARSGEFWDAATEYDRGKSSNGFSLKGRIKVIPMVRERMLEVFSPPDSPEELQDDLSDQDDVQIESLLKELRREEAVV